MSSNVRKLKWVCRGADVSKGDNIGTAGQLVSFDYCRSKDCRCPQYEQVSGLVKAVEEKK